MSTRTRTSHKSRVTVTHWLMFALSLLTIAWITFSTTGG